MWRAGDSTDVVPSLSWMSDNLSSSDSFEDWSHSTAKRPRLSDLHPHSLMASNSSNKQDSAQVPDSRLFQMKASLASSRAGTALMGIPHCIKGGGNVVA